MDCKTCNFRNHCGVTPETKASERFKAGDCWLEEHPLLWPIESEDVEIELRQIDSATIKFVPKTTIERLCRMPYPGHKHGCPNHCPIEDRSDILQKYFNFILVLARYDLQAHKDQMKAQHPLWSDRMQGNCLHWQGHVKRVLKEAMIANSRKGDLLFASGSGFVVRGEQVHSLECGCMHVFATLARNRIKFEPKPRHIVTLVGLICKPAAYNDLSKWVKK